MSAVPSAPPAAATPFPEGDPRNAKYFENLAALEHTLNNTLAADKQDLTDAQSAYNYSTGELERQLPLTLRATRNTANAHGLLESGQLAQAAGGVEAKYAQQRGRLASGLQASENKVHQAEQSAREAFNLGRQRDAVTALEEGKTEAEKEAPDEQPGEQSRAAAGAAPAAPKVTGAPAVPRVVRQVAQKPSAGRARSRSSAVPRVAPGTGGTRAPGGGRRAARQQAAKRAVVG